MLRKVTGVRAVSVPGGRSVRGAWSERASHSLRGAGKREREKEGVGVGGGQSLGESKNEIC